MDAVAYFYFPLKIVPKLTTCFSTHAGKADYNHESLLGVGLNSITPKCSHRGSTSCMSKIRSNISNSSGKIPRLDAPTISNIPFPRDRSRLLPVGSFQTLIKNADFSADFSQKKSTFQSPRRKSTDRPSFLFRLSCPSMVMTSAALPDRSPTPATPRHARSRPTTGAAPTAPTGCAPAPAVLSRRGRCAA